MNQQYQMTDYVTVEEYQTFRKAVGWQLFGDEQAKAGIDHTYHTACIRQNEKAVAMARLLWDRGYTAYIADVIVLPEYQGQGLGRALLEDLFQYMKTTIPEGYRVMISLVAAKGKDKFYEKFGFVTRPNEVFGPGMHLWMTF